MNGFLFETAKSLATALNQDGIFIVFASVVILTAIVNSILAFFVCDYCIKKRMWQPCVCVFIICVSCGVCLASGYDLFVPLLILGVSAIAIIPTFTISTRTFKVTEKQRNLVKFIDREIKQASKKQNFSVDEDIDFNRETIQLQPEEDETKLSDYELDFQHVKSVISRLDYFGLKESDKKQVKELELALLSAENGDFGLDVKSKINDGLGALLKIMSKYGV